jgi:catechol 2,3-dioxygenase-like lactoylglutathione lyase family enzyme
MFRNTPAFSSFSVNDLQAAKKFYSETLGLDVREQPEGLALNIAGGAKVFLYQKDDHTPATFTVLNFPVDDVAAAVTELKSRGIRFESYTSGDASTGDDSIFRGERGPAVAWFKDPAGNFLSVLTP